MKRFFNILVLVLVANQFAPGQKWTNRNSGTTKHLTDVVYVNSHTAVAVGLSGTILYSVDGGESWVSKASGVTFTLTAVAFWGEKGIIVGESSIYLRSMDGGQSWFKDTVESPGSSLKLRGVAWNNDSMVTAAGVNNRGAVLFQSTDGGEVLSWLPSTLLPENAYVNLRMKGCTALAPGRNGTIWWTENCGSSMSNISSTFSFTVLSADYIGSSRYNIVAAAVGGDTLGILLSTGWWRREIDMLAFDLFYLEDTTLVIVGTKIWRYKQLGEIWTTDTVSGSVRLWGVDFFDREHAVAVGENGKIITLGNVVTGVENEELPTEFSLAQNYPNPFNPVTTINYSLPQTDWVTVRVYNLLGSEVATLVDEKKPPGSYQVSWDADGFSSGVYFYKISAGADISVKKMVLLK